MWNKYFKCSKISEARFRHLVKCFALDQTATETGSATGISLRSVNAILLRIRDRLAEIREVRSGDGSGAHIEDRHTQEGPTARPASSKMFRIHRLPMIPAGTRLGSYEILALIGAGAMGEVYRAFDPKLGREVAIKVLPASFSSDPERLRRFEQEARTTGSLNHANVMVVFDFGSHEGAPYLVMELLEGETLRQKLGSKAMPAKKAMEIAAQIARGLSAAHEKGVIHRDLKPENLFLTKTGLVKILDFGLAKQEMAPTSGESSTRAFSHGRVNTQEGMVMGTVGYMSPEQVRGERLDPRTDLFSLGVVLWEMVTGARPFLGGSAVETMNAILTADLPELNSSLRIPPGLARILETCLAKSPSSRFHSAHDLAFALESVSLTGTGSQPFPATSAPFLRRSWALGLGALSLATLAGLTGWMAGAVPRVEVEALSDRNLEVQAARVLPRGRGIALSARAARGEASRLYVLSEAGLHALPSTEGGQLLDVFPDGSLLVGFDLPNRPWQVATLTIEGGKPIPASTGVVWLLPWISGGRPWRVRIGPDKAGTVSRLFESFESGREEGNWVIRHSIPLASRVLGGGLLGRFRLDQRGDRLYWMEAKGAGVELVTLDAKAKVERCMLRLPSGAQELSAVFQGGRGMLSCQANHRTLIGNLDAGSGSFRVRTELPGHHRLVDLTTEGDPVVVPADSRFRLRWGRLPNGEEREVQLFGRQTFVGLSADGSRLLVGNSYGEGGTLHRWEDPGPQHLAKGRFLGLSLDGKSLLVAEPSDDGERLVCRSVEGQQDQDLGEWRRLHTAATVLNGKRWLVQGLGKADEGLGPRFSYLIALNSKYRRLGSEVACPAPDGLQAIWTEPGEAPTAWGVQDLANNQRITPPFRVPVGFRPHAWSTDGRELLGEARLAPASADIRAMDLRTGKERTIRSLAIPTTVGDARDVQLRVSPQGGGYALFWAEPGEGRLFVIKGLR